MNEEQIQVGHISRQADGSFEGELQRVFYGHPRTAVWKMLTDPASIPLWLAPGTIEPRQGGRAQISFEDSGIAIDSEVKAYVELSELAYSWSSGNEPERLVYWKLTDTDEGTLLTLTVNTTANDDVAKACAGFEAHLEMLAAALEGIPVKFPFNLYLQARTAYSQQLEQ